jgi:RNA polymerase sigma factor (sigma-70 family)
LAVDAVEQDAPVHELIGSLRSLPIRQRTVVVLRFYEDLPEADIADLLGIRIGTVKSRLHRALARLREEVER